MYFDDSKINKSTVDSEGYLKASRASMRDNRMYTVQEDLFPYADIHYIKTTANKNCNKCSGQGHIGMLAYTAEAVEESDRRLNAFAWKHFGLALEDLDERQQRITFAQAGHINPVVLSDKPTGTERNKKCDECGKKKKRCNCWRGQKDADHIYMVPCVCVKNSAMRRKRRIERATEDHSRRLELQAEYSETLKLEAQNVQETL